MRFTMAIAVLASCGRYGFNSDLDGGRSKDGHEPFVDADYHDAVGTVGIDAAAPDNGPAACANYVLTITKD